jgi:hypothetical protein
MPEDKQLEMFTDMPAVPEPEPERSLLADTGRMDPRRRHRKTEDEKRQQHRDDPRRKQGKP